MNVGRPTYRKDTNNLRQEARRTYNGYNIPSGG